MVFVGGKLSLKGDKKKGKKKKSKSKHDKKKSSRDEEEAAAVAATANDSNGSDVDEDEMTEAERKAQKYKQQAEKKDLEKVAKQSHRDRVEEYSQKLSQLTELNDIPRVSATCMWADASCVDVLGWKRKWSIFVMHWAFNGVAVYVVLLLHMLWFTLTNTFVTLFTVSSKPLRYRSVPQATDKGRSTRQLGWKIEPLVVVSAAATTAACYT